MRFESEEKRLLFIIRAITAFYIFALLFWGVTAFPLESEIRLLCSALDISQELHPDNYEGLRHWIATVNEGIVQTNMNYPFLAYGTDWLAFSHIVIAAAFLGLYAKPVRNVWIVYFGMIACIGVVPLAVICGPVRGIPFWWTLVDCSFCLLGLIPLLILHALIKRLSSLTSPKFGPY